MDLAGSKIRTSKIEVLNKKGVPKNFIIIKSGEHLILSNRETLGKREKYGKENNLIIPSGIGFQLPQIIDDLEIGDVVFFDDGTIEAVVISKEGDDAKLTITKAFKDKL